MKSLSLYQSLSQSLSLSSSVPTTVMAMKLYHKIGSFNVWLIGFFLVTLSWALLYKIFQNYQARQLQLWQTAESGGAWVAFFAVTLIPYIVSTGWALPQTKLGSWKSLESIVHRVSGIASLLLPMTLMVVETVTGAPPSPVLYGLALVSVTLNCFFGALLIPKRIPSYDVPTVRAFAVGVTLGLSFVALSLMWAVGDRPWFDLIGRVLAVFSIYTVVLAWTDSLRHIHVNRSTPFYRTQIDLDYFYPPKTASEVGLIHRKYSLGAPFFSFFFNPPPADPVKVREVTVTPSSAAVIFTVTMTAVFALTTLMQIHYLVCGYEGMIYRKKEYPRISQWSVYQSLLAAVANNFGTFAGTLVVQRKVTTFWGAAFNAIGLLIPVVSALAFQLRVPTENLIDSTFLMRCAA